MVVTSHDKRTNDLKGELIICVSSTDCIWGCHGMNEYLRPKDLRAELIFSVSCKEPMGCCAWVVNTTL